MPSTRSHPLAVAAALAVPDHCGGCGEALALGRSVRGLPGWCTHCVDRWGEVPGAWSANAGCPGWAAAVYAGRVRRAVLAAKRGAPAAATGLLLARWPADVVAAEGLVVTWVPAHPRRAIAAPDAGRALAAAVAAQAGAPLQRLLWRTPWARRQAGRDDAARRRDPQRLGLRAVGRAPRRVLLVDDVRTTGTTLDHAASLLRAAGAIEVSGVTVAMAPTPRGR